MEPDPAALLTCVVGRDRGQAQWSVDQITCRVGLGPAATFKERGGAEQGR